MKSKREEGQQNLAVTAASGGKANELLVMGNCDTKPGKGRNLSRRSGASKKSLVSTGQIRAFLEKPPKQKGAIEARGKKGGKKARQT